MTYKITFQYDTVEYEKRSSRTQYYSNKVYVEAIPNDWLRLLEIHCQEMHRTSLRPVFIENIMIIRAKVASGIILKRREDDIR